MSALIGGISILKQNVVNYNRTFSGIICTFWPLSSLFPTPWVSQCSRNFIHRDLKPSNIVLGAGKHANLVYIIDFGLSKEFRDPNTCAHIPYSCGCGFTGTTAFTSINSHLGLELGRRISRLHSNLLPVWFFAMARPEEGYPSTQTGNHFVRHVAWPPPQVSYFSRRLPLTCISWQT